MSRFSREDAIRLQERVNNGGIDVEKKVVLHRATSDDYKFENQVVMPNPIPFNQNHKPIEEQDYTIHGEKLTIEQAIDKYGDIVSDEISRINSLHMPKLDVTSTSYVLDMDKYLSTNAMYRGDYLTHDKLEMLGFVRIDVRAMGAVRTTKNIAVMPMEKMKSAGNKSAKRRWLAYCAYKDLLRSRIGVIDGCSAVEVVYEMVPPKSSGGKVIAKRDRLAMYGKPSVCKPDVDNVIKGIMDACMVEDKGVSRVFGSKWYGIQDILWVRVIR